MREDVLAGVVGVLFGQGVELGFGVVGEGWAGPFALGLEEEGEGVGADVSGVGDSVLDTAGGGDVGADVHGPLKGGDGGAGGESHVVGGVLLRGCLALLRRGLLGGGLLGLVFLVLGGIKVVAAVLVVVVEVGLGLGGGGLALGGPLGCALGLGRFGSL